MMWPNDNPQGFTSHLWHLVTITSFSKQTYLGAPPKKQWRNEWEGFFLPPLLCMSLIWTRIEKEMWGRVSHRAVVNGSAFLCPLPTFEDQLQHCGKFERHLFEGRRLTNDTRVQACTQNIEQHRLQFRYLWMNSGAMCGSVMPVEISSQPRDKETGRKDRLQSLKHVLTCDIKRPQGVSGINKQKACLHWGVSSNQSSCKELAWRWRGIALTCLTSACT